jgi:hypothetical protein
MHLSVLLEKLIVTIGRFWKGLKKGEWFRNRLLFWEILRHACRYAYVILTLKKASACAPSNSTQPGWERQTVRRLIGQLEIIVTKSKIGYWMSGKKSKITTAVILLEFVCLNTPSTIVSSTVPVRVDYYVPRGDAIVTIARIVLYR